MPDTKKPIFSEDGRYYWDGEAWQPVPNQPPVHASLKVDQTVGMKPSNAFTTSFFGSLGNSAAGCGGCLLAIVVVIVLFASCVAATTPHS